MRPSNEHARLHRKATLCFIAMLSMNLAGCASATPPCAQVESGLIAVSGHNSFQFRRNWKNFRYELAEFREAVTEEDAQKLRATTTRLSQSIATISRYSPRRAGKACDAYAMARVTLDASVTQLEQLSVDTYWPVANTIALEVTEVSEHLREALPSSWFTRHRHGKRFH